MAVPSCDFGNFLLASRTEPVLFFPEVNKPSFPFEGIYHVYVETFFIVGFPFWVVRVCFSFDLHMPFDWHLGSLREIIFPSIHLSIEDPMIPSNGLEVLLRDPFV